MSNRTVVLSPDDNDDLRAGLSLARIRWRMNLERGDAGPWTMYSAESMRLSADLYHFPDNGGVLHCSMHSASCISAAAQVCMTSSNPDVAALAPSLLQIALRIRDAFNDPPLADRSEPAAPTNRSRAADSANPEKFDR